MRITIHSISRTVRSLILLSDTLHSAQHVVLGHKRAANSVTLRRKNILTMALVSRDIHTQVSTSLRESRSRQPGFSGCPFISKGPFGPSLNNLYSLIPRGIRKVGQLSLPD